MFFFLLFVRWQRRHSLGIALLWLLYTGYELGMKLELLCVDCQERSDLALIYPILLASSAASIVLLVSIPRGRKRRFH